jgi:hypothetical protein
MHMVRFLPATRQSAPCHLTEYPLLIEGYLTGIPWDNSGQLLFYESKLSCFGTSGPISEMVRCATCISYPLLTLALLGIVLHTEHLRVTVLCIGVIAPSSYFQHPVQC